MKTEPKLKPGDVVRYISRSKEFRPGPYKALNKTVNSWTIQHLETGRVYDWVGAKALERTTQSTAINLP